MNIRLTGRMRLPLTILSALIVTAGTLATLATAAAPASAVPGVYVVNYNSGLCLGIAGDKNDADAVQWDCNGHADQIWHWGSQNSSYPGWYQLVNENGSCLGVAGGSLTEGAQVVGWTCLGSSHLDQYWFVESPFCGGAYFPFEDLNSGLVLGVSGNSKNEGAAVVQWAYQDTCNNQFWLQETELLINS